MLMYQSIEQKLEASVVFHLMASDAVSNTPDRTLHRAAQAATERRQKNAAFVLVIRKILIHFVLSRVTWMCMLGVPRSSANPSSYGRVMSVPVTVTSSFRLSSKRTLL